MTFKDLTLEELIILLLGIDNKPIPSILHLKAELALILIFAKRNDEAKEILRSL
jgi:hypothetical protein